VKVEKRSYNGFWGEGPFFGNAISELTLS